MLCSDFITSSGSNHENDDDDDTEDEGPVHFRGRTFSNSRLANTQPLKKHRTDADSPQRSSLNAESPIPFTRSRSPAINRMQSNGIAAMRNASPAVFAMPTSGPTTVFPSHLQLHVHCVFLPWTWTFSIDSKKAGECVLLLGSLLYACSKLADTSINSPVQLYNLWTITGI